MIRIFGWHRDHGFRAEIPRQDLPALLGGEGWRLWVDLEKPTRADLTVLAEAFHFHPLAIEDCQAPRHHPKLDDYGDYLFLIVHGVAPEASHRQFITRELDLFVNRSYLVTVHRARLRSIDGVRETLVRRPDLLAEGPDFVMHAIIDAQVDRYLPVLDDFGRALEEMEDHLFREPGPELLETVLEVRGAVLRLRRIAGHQREILHRLTRGGLPQISERCGVYLRDVYDHIVRVTDLAENYRELATGVLEGYVSSVSLRLNETMKILTAFASIFIPLTLVAGIYGMNFDHMPELHWRYGYPFVLLLMAVLGAGLYLFFRRRKLI